MRRRLTISEVQDRLRAALARFGSQNKMADETGLLQQNISRALQPKNPTFAPDILRYLGLKYSPKEFEEIDQE